MIDIPQQLLQHPVYQALASIILAFLMLLLFRPVQLETVWVIAGLTYVLFIGLNSIMIWFSEEPWLYILWSLLTSVAYLFLANWLVMVYSSLKQTEGSGESGMIFLVIIYHPFALGAVILTKWLYEKFYS